MLIPQQPMKRCTHCKRQKPLDEYHKNKAMVDGRQNNCKECVARVNKKRPSQGYSRERYLANKWRLLERDFGLTRELYASQLAAQSCVCMNCCKPQVHGFMYVTVFVGQVFVGLVCNRCHKTKKRLRLGA